MKIGSIQCESILTMPQPSKKSARAKFQQCQGGNNFVSAQYSDSASDYTLSSPELSSESDVSSDESVTAVHLLYGIPTKTTKKQKPIFKAPYMGNS